MSFSYSKQMQSYAIANKIPEVLDQLYCFCQCDQSIGHHSLLSCFADNHASMCGICMDEAILADEMHKDGKSISAIANEIDKRYWEK